MEKKELKDLDLLDRFLFAEAIEDPETMELILEIILGREVILKHLPQAEKEQRSFLWSKQVKLDVWAKDIDDCLLYTSGSFSAVSMFSMTTIGSFMFTSYTPCFFPFMEISVNP